MKTQLALLCLWLCLASTLAQVVNLPGLLHALDAQDDTTPVATLTPTPVIPTVPGIPDDESTGVPTIPQQQDEHERSPEPTEDAMISASLSVPSPLLSQTTMPPRSRSPQPSRTETRSPSSSPSPSSSVSVSPSQSASSSPSPSPPSPPVSSASESPSSSSSPSPSPSPSPSDTSTVVSQQPSPTPATTSLTTPPVVTRKPTSPRPTRRPTKPPVRTEPPTASSESPLAPTRSPTNAAQAPVQSNATTIPQAPSRLPSPAITPSLVDARPNASLVLAPTRRPRHSTTLPSPANPVACDAEEKKLLFKYYSSNQRLQDECTASTGGYTFPFSGFPSGDQIKSIARTNPCLVLLQGVGVALKKECLIGDMPVQTTAAKILVLAKSSSTASLPTEAQLRETVNSAIMNGTSPTGGTSVETGTGEAGDKHSTGIVLSSDLQIISGWQFAPERNETAGTVVAPSDNADITMENRNASDSRSEKPSSTDNKASGNLKVDALGDKATSAAASPCVQHTLFILAAPVLLAALQM